MPVIDSIKDWLAAAGLVVGATLTLACVLRILWWLIVERRHA